MIILPHFQGVATKSNINTSFDVNTLSPAIWLDASDSSKLFNATVGGTTPADGEMVKRWEDKSSNLRHITESTNAPIRKVSVQNGKDIIRFSASTGTRLTASTAADWKFLHDGATYYVFAIVKYGTSTNSEAGYILIDTCGVASINIGTSILYDDRVGIGNNCHRHFTAKGQSGATVVNIFVPNTITPTQFLLHTIKGDSDAISAANRSFGWVNGLALSYSNLANQAVSSLNPTYPLRVGQSGLNGTPLEGDIAELIIVPNEITTQQKNNCENYLLAKWGII